MRDGSVSATKLTSAGHAKRYRQGRTCGEPGCETVLSMYNSTQFCWEHRRLQPIRTRGVA